jgi:hypothetical protein
MMSAQTPADESVVEAQELVGLFIPQTLDEGRGASNIRHQENAEGLGGWWEYSLLGGLRCSTGDTPRR